MARSPRRGGKLSLIPSPLEGEGEDGGDTRLVDLPPCGGLLMRGPGLRGMSGCACMGNARSHDTSRR